jgi:phage gp29-like protein
MAILDAYGRPVQVKALTTMQAEPRVTGVRQLWTGSTASGLTPVRLAGILRAADTGDLHEYLTLAEEMEERDPHYFAVLGIRKRVVSGVRPTVIPAGDDARSREIAEAVERDIARHDGFADLVEDLLDAFGKGFSVVEFDWATNAKRWWFKRFVHVDPRSFVFDRATGSEVRLRTEGQPAWGEELAPFKYAVHRAKMKSGLVYRGGLARIVAFGWMCKAYTLKDWMAFIETYGQPLRLGKYGPEATKQDIDALFRAVANIGTDAAAVLPKSMEIAFEKGVALGGTDALFESLARWSDEQVSKAVLGQTMTSDNGSSQSQATVHNEVRHDVAAADARAVTMTLNRDVVRPYVDLNFGVQQAYPRLSIEVAEPEDIKAKIDGAVALMGQGVKFRATELRDKLGFSDPEAGDEIAGGVPAAAPPPPAANAARVALNRQADEDALDEIGADMLSDWEEVAGGMEAAIAEALDGAGSYDEALARLPEALRLMPTAVLVETLVKGMFRARAFGDGTDG